MAGLLDFLMPDQAGAGLLDFLRHNAMAQQFPVGLPSDTAQYGPGPQQQAPAAAPSAAAQPPGWNSPWPQDNMPWPQGPIGAPSSVNAQARMPTPQAPPQAPAAPPVAPASMAPAQAPQPGPISGFLNRAADAIMSIPRGGAPDPAVVAAQTANRTAQALISRGVPQDVAIAAVQPGNAEMLKTLVSQAFGPPKAPTALGQGYIYNPNTNKVERAYEPEDKIPIGFEKTDNGLRPIPGGPADPAYLRAKATNETDPNAVKVLGKGGELYKIGPDGQPVIVHKNQDSADATLSDDTVKAMASQYLAGDKTVLQNLGRGAQGAANIVKIREEISRQAHDAGLSAKDIVTTFNEQAGALAGQRAVGTRAANISLAANEANSMIPIALDASAKVPRGDWMPWNKMVQAYQKGSSSPELASFVAATNSLVNAYVRAVSPTGVPTDSMREHAYEMLNSAQGPEAYKAVIATMQKEMQAALSAPEHVKEALRGKTEQKAEGGAPSFNDRFVGDGGAIKPGAYVWTPEGLQPK
jgi:hypothetical protein